MFFYKLDYAIGKIFTTEPRQERLLIQKYTGARLSERDAIRLWDLIVDHKWYLSERLNRDVGIHMAAVDYVENFYVPVPAASLKNQLFEVWNKFVALSRLVARAYFEAKSKTNTY